MRRGEGDELDRNAHTSRTPSPSLNTQFNKLDLQPPPGLLMRMPSNDSDGDFGRDATATTSALGGSRGPSEFDHPSLTRQPSGTSDQSDASLANANEHASMLPREVGTWTSGDVGEWLHAVGLASLTGAFAEHGIDGYLLLRLTEHDLDRDLAIPSNLQRVKVYRAIENLRRTVRGGVRDTSGIYASPMTLTATTTITSSDSPGANRHGTDGSDPLSRSTSDVSTRGERENSRSAVYSPSNDSSYPKRQGSGKSMTLSDGTRGSETSFEADLSWLQYVHREARKGALAEWLLQKTKEIEEESGNNESPGVALNAYTQAALGALAVMSANGPNDQFGSGTDGSGSNGNVSRGNNSLPSPPLSFGSFPGSRGSARSRGSRGSGSEFGVRLREALESTPGWNSGDATFSSKPDIPWLQSRLADLVDELKMSSEKMQKTKSVENFSPPPPASVTTSLMQGDRNIFDPNAVPIAGPSTPLTPANLMFRGKEKESDFVEAIEAEIVARVESAKVEVASTMSAQDEIAEMQLALMNSQQSAMAEMHEAAAVSEAAAFQEFELANSESDRKNASALLDKASARQRELALQEMQQSVMASQQTLAAEVMLRQRSDAAEAGVLLEKHESMASEMKVRYEENNLATAAHQNAMDVLLEHAEAMRSAIASGNAAALLETQTEISEAAMAQRSTRREMLAQRESLSVAEHEQDEVFAVMARAKVEADAGKARFAKATAAAQVNIQTAQEEVMRRAVVMQNALEVLPENIAVALVDRAEESSSVNVSNPSDPNNPGMSEEWEIKFDDIEFKPGGIPCGDNRIGHGGFGEVFLGQLGGMNVAVKRLFNQEHAQQGMREFRAEVSILSRLRHPSIVLWLGASTTAPNCTIVLEYMDRGSLSQLLHRSDTPYTLVTAVKWCISIARGMLYLHQHKPFPIIHCDLNSNNVLVNREWVVKITDFGLSKVKRTSRLSRRSGIIGTVNYAAPEVIRGAPSSESSDVYAFGVLAWEILTRKIPWKDLTEYQIIYKMTAAMKRPMNRQNATTENFDVPDDSFPTGAQKMLHDCWVSKSTDRPFFPQLVEECREMLRAENAKTRETKG